MGCEKEREGRQKIKRTILFEVDGDGDEGRELLCHNPNLSIDICNHFSVG
jgi:hypothetical protein